MLGLCVWGGRRWHAWVAATLPTQVKGGFKQKLTLPDGTLWSSAKRSDGSVRLNTNDQVRCCRK